MLQIIKKISLSAVVVVALSGCQYEQLNRSETMSDSAGNAIAHNSALQIIDPWPRSAGNDNLRVPAGEYGAHTLSGDTSSTSGSETSSK